MQNIKTNKWFSFVELIVSVTILAIISTIWFISYSSYLWDSRDSQRKSDLQQIWSALKVYKQKKWYFPFPWNYYDIVYNNTNVVAHQWYFDEQVRLSTLDRLPLDPKIKIPYTYSITKTKQEYEISATLENEDNAMAIVDWNYKSVSVNILPSIILALKLEFTNPPQTAEIMEWDNEWDNNRRKFIFNEQDYNLAYDFIEPYEPKSDWEELNFILNELNSKKLYWQNTDNRNCNEIKESWKALVVDWSTNLEYQIVSSTWALSNTWCTF